MFESYMCEKCGEAELEEVEQIADEMVRGYCPVCDEMCEVEITLED